MAKGFCYLVAIMDPECFRDRRVLAWRLSNTLDTSFCTEALEEALGKFGTPEIFNTDQGSQFTAEAFTKMLISRGINISPECFRDRGSRRILSSTTIGVGIRALTEGHRMLFTAVCCLRSGRRYEQAAYHL